MASCDQLVEAEQLHHPYQYKMEKCLCGAGSIRKGDFMFLIDLKDAYFG